MIPAITVAIRIKAEVCRIVSSNVLYYLINAFDGTIRLQSVIAILCLEVFDLWTTLGQLDRKSIGVTQKSDQVNQWTSSRLLTDTFDL